ncbi:LEAF RUST 10 DISEASE-RESISTANCE LOCUS RECEPTOR-LIKE PROTEIN KINASE-like 1.2 [Melia azedarach]|uniref:LEAF RUST 10 DISEASE-RESISTANCE LOCUS RECEPTOR-LIKE PROTEIN KINASE-like 1.2 n=1 Tax=Melia azedarach TaxID=155640 RepID=A0ACC1XEY7_MELAZ|nr:LEAF RUST 10 DISEASE-RESISTANCE LOCUS RECEPTOR-LIKE PROTEIN KINASE-like 1.2 [Melia azedarach]
MSSHLELQNLFSFRILGIMFFTGTILVESVQSTDLSKYEACKPSNCGSGPNISYPFYIRDAGTDFCGFPGFLIECKQKKPVYKTSKGYFTIEDISYENQSFRLLDEEVFNDTCIAPVQNFSFDRSSLNFIPYHADLYFFHNCNTSFYLNYTTSEVACAANATRNTTTFVALVPRDEDLNCSSIACDSVISSPVQLGEEEINQTVTSFDYVKLLKDGFSLKWTGYNCAHCRKSGGQCGFENETSVCFCPDGSHPYSCNNGRLTANFTTFFFNISTSLSYSQQRRDEFYA